MSAGVVRRRHAGETAPVHCPLCAARIEDSRTRCAACPAGIACESICCPRCGYRFVDRSLTFDFFRGLILRIRSGIGRDGGGIGGAGGGRSGARGVASGNDRTGREDERP